MHDRTRDRRTRKTFWVDDRIVDDFAPVMGRYPFGVAALAVYTVLARRADRDGDSFPSLGRIAEESGVSQRTVQRALRLLELLGLVEIATCFEEGSQRQTSNLYTLLTPPDPLPEIDPDPGRWPPPQRRILLVRGSGANRSEVLPAARVEQQVIGGLGRPGEGSVWAGLVPIAEGPPRQADTLSPASMTPLPRQADTLPPVSLTPLEGYTDEGSTRKEGARASFVIAEVGLTNRQVWAAALAELARRGEVSAGEIETWLRPAALVGREGRTLLVGAPNAVARDRIARRFLPAVKAAIAATVGTDIGVSVVIEKGRDG